MPDAIELLFHSIEAKAIILQKEATSGRKCILCESCTSSEDFYLKHIQSKGYIERTGYFCLSLKNNKIFIDLNTIKGMKFKDISQDFASYKESILYNESLCFADDAATWDEFEDVMNKDYFVAYAAFNQ